MFYTDIIDKTYKDNPNLANESYDKQLKTFFDLKFGWADFWKINLEKTNEFVAQEIIINAKPLQIRWAKEHNVKYQEDNWILDILAAQIAHYKTNVFFDDSGIFVTPEFKASIKKKNPDLKIILMWEGVGIGEKYLQNSDIILTCHPGFKDQHIQQGFNSHLMPFAFQKSLLDQLNLNKQKYNVSFAGSVGLYKNGHLERLNLLSRINKKLPLDLFISGMKIDLLKRHQIRHIITGKLNIFREAWQLTKKNNGGVFGLKMYEVLANSKITINSHINISGKYAANMRLFEATGAGTCLLTDHKENLGDYFEVDKEIVTYTSIEDCLEKIEWLLKNEKKREEIAKAGQQRTFTEHTYESRVNALIDIINPYL